jgi:Fe-S cluster assembly ATP-binding protein
MLSITKLTVQSKEKKTLVSIENITVVPDTISLVVGKNGSGKTSFLHGLFLHPSVMCDEREISLQDENISNMLLLDMYTRGLQYVPQHLIPLPGVSFISFLHIAYEKKFSEKTSLITFVENVKKTCDTYGLPKHLIEKNVHENLSGGERKMQELIQVVVLKPKYLFLDEIDAGLDRDAKIIVATVINRLKTEGVGIMLVSHSFEFTELLRVDTVHLMDLGKIIRTGDTSVLHSIKEDGFTQ